MNKVDIDRIAFIGRTYKEYLDDILSILNADGIKADIVGIPFEFQKWWKKAGHRIDL